MDEGMRERCNEEIRRIPVTNGYGNFLLLFKRYIFVLSKFKMVVNDIEIEVERKAIKHLHLAVYPPNGRVHASAPNEYTEEQIRMFILKKWTWITQKRKETT